MKAKFGDLSYEYPGYASSHLVNAAMSFSLLNGEECFSENERAMKRADINATVKVLDERGSVAEAAFLRMELERFK